MFRPSKAAALLKKPILPWVATTVVLTLICRYVLDTDAMFDAVCSFNHVHGAWQIDETLVTLCFLSIGWLGVAIYRGIRLSREAEWRRVAEERAIDLASHDTLTGLLSRRAFTNEVNTALGSSVAGAAHALLFIDIDGFKLSNDVHGHDFGDAMLAAFAERLRLIDGAPIISRLGGDEFGVFLTAADGCDHLREQLADLHARITTPMQLRGHTILPRASVGVSRCGTGQATAEFLLRTADIAMYRGKKAGGGRVTMFETWMDEELQQQGRLRAQLSGAIAEGQVVPFFQPFIDLETGALAGFEVLARWHHPEQGLVPPAGFIELAEKEGLIDALFFSVLSQACKAARHWNPHLMLTVNVSPMQLVDPSLAARILAELKRLNYDPCRLEVEITESALVRDQSLAKSTIVALRAAGICVSLDDFGTGFSSLYHLKEMPFDKFKLDRSFITNSVTDPQSQRYARAILELGKTLGLKITAEGIEDAATADWLRSSECTYGQGYLYGRPVSLAATEAMDILPARHRVAANA